jgi:riboflavin kinase
MDVQRGKPDPQVFLLAAARAGVEPRRSVVVEDARPGIEAARRAGMASVALVSTGRHEDDFRPVHPDLVVRSLCELTPSIFRGLLARHNA